MGIQLDSGGGADYRGCGGRAGFSTVALITAPLVMKKNLLLIFICCCSALSAAQPYKVIAYYTGTGENIRQFPVAKLTHIIFSFLKIQNDTLTFHNEDQAESLSRLVALKKEYPRLKIMVSIGGWGGCSFCSDLFADSLHRENFAKTTVALFRKCGIDGLDLDWEYPAIEGYPGHKYDRVDRMNFTKLVKALRKEMGTEFLLSFAAGGFEQYIQQSVDWDAVLPEVDFVNLMTYDLVNGYAAVTGHHTLLRDYRTGQESVSKCVNLLLDKKAASRKLIVGAAMYARIWENVPDTNHGLWQQGRFKGATDYKEFSQYFNDTSGYQYYWDKKGKAPYRYNAAKHLFATFDDKRSIKHKARFIRRKKLGGLMFWELTADNPTNGLAEEMSKRLNGG